MPESSETNIVGGDQIKVGDISGSVAAIGQGAQVIYHHVERALTSVEVAEQSTQQERQRLAEAVTTHVQRLQNRAEQATQDTVTSPYRALLEYDIDDAALFYGRSAAIRMLQDRLGRSSLTVLHAESGAGKTSLLKAGIVPRLLAAGSVPLYVRPYQTPGHYAIKRALLPQLEQTPGLAIASLHDFMRYVTDLLGGQPMVVLLDQFEEIFTVQRPESRAEFISELAPCLDDDLLPAKWLFALRSEWFGKLGTFRPDIKNPFANELLLRALNADEAREIIMGPVSRYGVTYDESLPARLISDLGDQEIAPPQLQLVTSALFDARPDSGAITTALYETLGGASGILRNHLERVLSREVPPEHRDAARRLLEALVSSEKRRVLRSREELQAELGAQGIEPQVVELVLHALIESRLLRMDEIGADQATVGFELAHDYLLDEIELDPAAQSRKAAQELLTREVESYQRHSTLLSADKLVIIEAQADDLVIDAHAQALLDKSRRALSRQRRNVYLGVGFVVLLVALAIFSVITTLGATRLRQSAEATAGAAQTQSVDAQRAQSTADAGILDAQAQGTRIAASASEAEQQAESARGTSLALRVSQYLDQGDVISAYQSAADAWSTTQTEEAARALLTAAYTPLPDAVLNVGRDASGVYVNSDGSQAIILSTTRGVNIWDFERGEIVYTLFDPAVTKAPYYANYVAGGSRILTASLTDQLQLWNAEDGEFVATLDAPAMDISWMQTSIDDQRLYVLFIRDDSQGVFGVWDTSTGERLYLLDLPDTEGDDSIGTRWHTFYEVPEHSRVLLGSEQSFAMWDYEADELLWTKLIESIGTLFPQFSFTPDGKFLYYLPPDALGLQLFDSSTGEVAEMFTDDSIRSVQAPAGHDGIFVMHTDGAITIHGDLLLTTTLNYGIPTPGNPPAYSKDGEKFAYQDSNNTVHVRLDQKSESILLSVNGPTGSPIALDMFEFTDDSRYLITLGQDGTLARWNLADQTAQAIPTNDAGLDYVSAVDISRSGTTMALGFSNQTLIVDTATGAQIQAIEGSPYIVFLSGDGQRVAIKPLDDGTDSPTVTVWDIPSKQRLQTLPSSLSNFLSMGLNEDGSRIAIIDVFDETLDILNTETGQKIAELEPNIPTVDFFVPDLVQFLPDDRIVVAGLGGVIMFSPDGQEQLWTYDPLSFDSISQMHISPDGETIVIVQLPRLTWLDAATGEVLFSSQINDFVNVALSPDRSYFFAGMFDGSVDVLNGHDASWLTTLVGAQGNLLDMAVTPDGQYLLTKGQDGVLMRWPIGGDLLFEIVKDRLARLSYQP